MPVRPKIVVAIAIVAVAAGMLLARAALNVPAAVPVLTKATLLTPARVLPDFALLDHDSKAFDRSRLQRQWTLLFFGFTQCPDICPTTLGLLSQAKRQLSDLPPAQRPQVVLVTTDPQHDSAAQLGPYVRFFNPDFIGVTGSAEEIQRVAQAFSVSMTQRPLADGSYTVDHSTTIFLVDPQGALRAVFSTPHSPDVIADDYRRILVMG
jgi:protein SCO1/2